MQLHQWEVTDIPGCARLGTYGLEQVRLPCAVYSAKPGHPGELTMRSALQMLNRLQVARGQKTREDGAVGNTYAKRKLVQGLELSGNLGRHDPGPAGERVQIVRARQNGRDQGCHRERSQHILQGQEESGLNHDSQKINKLK